MFSKKATSKVLFYSYTPCRSRHLSVRVAAVTAIKKEERKKRRSKKMVKPSQLPTGRLSQVAKDTEQEIRDKGIRRDKRWNRKTIVLKEGNSEGSTGATPSSGLVCDAFCAYSRPWTGETLRRRTMICIFCYFGFCLSLFVFMTLETQQREASYT